MYILLKIILCTFHEARIIIFLKGILNMHARPGKYSEKATTFCKISTLLLTVCTVVKSKVEISRNFVAFSEYMNFTINKVKQFGMRRIWYEEDLE